MSISYRNIPTSAKSELRNGHREYARKCLCCGMKCYDVVALTYRGMFCKCRECQMISWFSLTTKGRGKIYRDIRKQNDVPVDTRIKVYDLFNSRCNDCNNDENLQIHHIDGDCFNHGYDNLLLVCKNCHLNKYHSNGDGEDI